MRITQGTFSYLPDLTDDEIRAQAQYALDRQWSISVQFTDDPHPRNAYWEMWGQPMFDTADAVAVVSEVNRCREAFPDQYVKVSAYDPTRGRQTTALEFIAQRPAHEPGFRLSRQERSDRRVTYSVHAYAADLPHGDRYRYGGEGRR